MNYAHLIQCLTADMKKGIQYKRIRAPYNIFIILAMIPLILSFILSKIIFYTILFSYKAISAPTEYLHIWIKRQKDEVCHITQAVIYFVCLPFVFSLQVLLSFSAVLFFILWFFIMVQAYLITLGGIDWQPFITEATFEESLDEYGLKPNNGIVSLFSVTAFVSLIFAIISLILANLLPSNLYSFCKLLNEICSYIYIILISIANPILFRRVKVQSSVDNELEPIAPLNSNGKPNGTNNDEETHLNVNEYNVSINNHENKQ